MYNIFYVAELSRCLPVRGLCPEQNGGTWPGRSRAASGETPCLTTCTTPMDRPEKQDPDHEDGDTEHRPHPFRGFRKARQETLPGGGQRTRRVRRTVRSDTGRRCRYGMEEENPSLLRPPGGKSRVEPGSSRPIYPREDQRVDHAVHSIGKGSP